MNDSARLENRKTPTIAVPGCAATLELHKGETLVQSLPLILVPEELNLIQL